MFIAKLSNVFSVSVYFWSCFYFELFHFAFRSEFKGKMAQNEFVNAFLQFQALLHLAAGMLKGMFCSIVLRFRLLYAIVLTSNVYDACVCACVCVCVCVLLFIGIVQHN